MSYYNKLQQAYQKINKQKLLINSLKEQININNCSRDDKIIQLCRTKEYLTAALNDVYQESDTLKLEVSKLKSKLDCKDEQTIKYKYKVSALLVLYGVFVVLTAVGVMYG